MKKQTTKESQSFQFQNGTLLVDRENIKFIFSIDSERKILPFNLFPKNDFFKITKDSMTDKYLVNILSKKSLFFNFLIKTSNIHWRKGSHASARQQQEQQQNLANKIYTIGYLLHQYKDKDKPWAVYATEYSENSQGQGGKSLFFKAISHIQNMLCLNGRDLESPFLYSRVTKNTDLVLFDDVPPNRSIINDIIHSCTGSMFINVKFKDAYELPFEESPKICFISECKFLDNSSVLNNRVLLTEFSDYYKEFDLYKEISGGLGIRRFFTDYTLEEWNYDLNFFAQCLHFYLKISVSEKINPRGNQRLYPRKE